MTADNSLVSDKITCSPVNDNEASYKRETTRVAAYSSLMSDKRTCSLVNDNKASYQALNNPDDCG